MNKKLLTFAAAAAVAVSASAATKVLVETDFSTMSAYSMWKSDATDAKIENGALVITNTEVTNFWEIQYMVADGFTVTGGTEYTITAKIKGFKGNLHFGIGTWSSTADGGVEVEESAGWQTVTTKVTGKADTDATAHLLFQSGDFVGVYQIESVKVTYEEEGGDTPEQPEDPKPEQPGEGVVASWYTGNDATFGGWGGSATFKQTTEDDKPCLAVTNPAESENPWDVQIGIDVTLENAKTYYLAFDVKGTAAEGITAGIQNSKDYSGKGDFTPFNITENWNRVVISATVNGEDADRITINLGKYVGSFYMTNVVLTTTNPAGLDAVEVAPAVDRWIVYNLMGVKVLDTDNEAALGELANGIYVINGKKVAIRR